MKKFLTVLLALSVVFTYTVGSAFAVTPSDSNAGDYILTEKQVQDNIDKAYNLALEKVEAEKNAALATIFDPGKTTADVTHDSETITVTKTAVEKVYADLYDAAIKAVKEKKEKVLNDASTAIGDVTGEKAYNGNFQKNTDVSDDNAWKAEGYAKYDANWEELATYLPDGDYETAAYLDLFDGTAATTANSKKEDVAKAVLAEVKEAALKAVSEISLDGYSKEYNGNAQSNYDKALADKTKAMNDISNIKAADPASWADCAAKIKNITDIYTAPVNQGNPGGYLYTGTNGYTGLNNIQKVADEPTEAAKLEWAQNKVLTEVKAQIDATVANAKAALVDATIGNADAATVAKLKDEVATAEEVAAAATEILTYLVKDCDNWAAFIYDTGNGKFDTSDAVRNGKWKFDANGLTVVVDGSKATFVPNNPADIIAKTYDATTILKIVQHVKDLKEEADIYKKAQAIDGAAAVEVDAALASAIDDTYKGDVAAELGLTDIIKLTYNTQKDLIGKDGSSVKVNGRKYASVNAWDDNLIRDYDEAYYDAVRKVMADTEEAIWAATTITDAEAAFLAGYEKLEAVPTIADKNTYQATKEYKDLYAEYANDIDKYATYKAGLITTSDYSWTKSTMVANLQDWLTDAYTTEELKESYLAAKAEIDNLKKAADLEAAKKALQDRVNALPKVATAADAEAVMALSNDIADHNDYCDLIGDTGNKVTFVSALTNAEKDVKAALKKAIKDQYDALYKDYKVTTDEADAVAALRAAVDAYVDYYSYEDIAPNDLQDIINEVSPVANKGTYADIAEDDLTNAQVKAFKYMVAQLPADASDVKGIEAARAAYEALPRDAKMAVYQDAAYDKLVDLEKLVIRHVEGLKIVASSKAVKGKITVKWKVKGDASAADGFQVYKSKKAQKDYKFMGKTKKLSMVNKKGLKKGTRYFYKVRAYKVVDGKKIYSDWSNKANRIAK